MSLGHIFASSVLNMVQALIRPQEMMEHGNLPMQTSIGRGDKVFLYCRVQHGAWCPTAFPKDMCKELNSDEGWVLPSD
jgi:hypothetical protein